MRLEELEMKGKDCAKKYFIITVDTEGDDCWGWKDGQPITTENVTRLPRFQALAEKFSFKPVYLTNYEVANDKRFINAFKQKQDENLCEIGLHIHAWNTPPIVDIPKLYSGQPYITEYNEEIIERKIVTTKDLLEKQFETQITSHRSGRWALSESYLRVLEKCGIKIDCSIVPQTSFYALAGRSVAHGSDYRRASRVPSYICGNIFEVPMTARKIRRLGAGSFKHRIKNLLLGERCWLRPLQMNAQALKRLTKQVEKERETDYVEFMIHSSELLPGANPYFQTEEDIEKLYECMEEYFSFLYKKGYVGVTLREYAQEKGHL